jgi:hypothetical protein
MAAAYAVRLIAARRGRPLPVPATPRQDAPVAEIIPLRAREPDPPAPTPVRESERRLLELADLRHELATRVDRRALYAMAHDRGLPHHALFSMGSEALLEAILDREEIPPPDVLPSQETVERMAAIADEAFGRHDRLLAEDAAALDAG